MIFKEFINVEKVLVVGKGLFEVLEWLVNFVVIICLWVVIVYRFLYFVKYFVFILIFIIEFFDYFEFLVMLSEFLLILGDFNIYMDLFDDFDCRNMFDFLVLMGFK